MGSVMSERKNSRAGRRGPVLIAAAVCVAMLISQVFCYAAYNTVPTKMYPSVVGVEILRDVEHQKTGEMHQMEMHIKFSNNVSAIDEEQEREAVNAPADTNPDYMVGVNERNLTKFHLVEKESQQEVDSENWTVEPHPEAKKQTDPSKFFYIYADNLDENTDYQVLIDEDLYANMGNSLGVPYVIDFNLGANTCTFNAVGEPPEDEHVQAPLTLDMINLENNDKDVPVDIQINLRFSYNVAGDEVFSYNAEQISLVKASDSSQVVDLDIQKGGEVQEIRIIPKQVLEEGTEYRLIIAKEFVARNGISLSSPLNIYFTTAGESANPGEGGSDNPGGGGGTGGTGGGSTGDDDVTTDNITINDTEHGEISVTPEDAEEGDSVVITATPGEGYVLESLTVTDSEGNELEMTENEDGTWTFTMPDSEVTIETVFREKPEDYFADITGTWAADDINQLADLGVVTGNPDGTFRPDSQITRAEIVAILVRLYDLDSETMVTFEDTQNHWASGYISIAASLGYVNGFDTAHFGPNEALTREQLAVMVTRIAGLQPSGGTALSFADSSAISGWAMDGVRAAFENGLISGYPDGTFRPDAEITRAEACHLIVNLINLQSDDEQASDGQTAGGQAA